MNLRDQILQADDLPRSPLVVPEWGGITIYLRTMTGRDRDRFEALFGKGVPPDARARLAVMVVCDDQGALAFTDADVPTLSEKSGAALDRIFEATCKLNKLRAKDYEDLGKPSASNPSDASSSASPSEPGGSTSTGGSPS